MASPTGGRFLFGLAPPSVQAVTLGINDGVHPVFPSPVGGNFNIEVFTNATVSTLPTLDAGFQAGVIDKGGTLIAPGFLTGTQLQLFSGNYVVVDSPTGSTSQSPALIDPPSGNVTMVGAGGDTLVGGPSGNQILNGLQQFKSGPETLIGGGGPNTVYAGPGDVVIGGAGNMYVDGTAGKISIKVGTGGTDTIVGNIGLNTISGASAGPDTITGGAAIADIAGLGKGDIVNFAGQTGNASVNAQVGGVSVTLGSGAASVFGGTGDTISFGSGSQYADGSLGTAMKINVGSAGGTDAVIGSAVAGGADTVLGGAASLNFNPGSSVGGGDLLNLAGSSGSANINAFSFKGADIANINDTVIAGNGGTTVDGGQGDRIGVGANASGTDLFLHATSIAGAVVGFGTNSSVAGSSTATVNIGTVASGAALDGFKETAGVATDFLFFPGETAGTIATVVASATTVTIGGVTSTQLSMPDGTTLNLIGIGKADVNATWFK